MTDKSKMIGALRDWRGPFRAGLVAAGIVATPALAVPPGDLPFGVYDPNGTFADDPGVAIEHLFLPWEDVFLPSLIDADNYALARGRTVLVTIEPWTWSREERTSAEALRTGIVSGEYDNYMKVICETLNLFQSPVTVRWAHEMEDVSGQFIWAGWDTVTYIAAYRRMVDICRAAAPDIQYMWSPLGREDLADYCPGDAYVDVIGLSVFGLQPWEQAVVGRAQSFREILGPRYDRALPFGKPIVVAELGYVGDADYVLRWENEVRQDIADFPELRAVVYFNQQEVYPWPDGFGYPDWQVTNNILE